MCTDQILSKLAYKLVDLGYKVSFSEDYSEFIVKADYNFNKMWDMTPNWEGILHVNQDKIILTVITVNFFKNIPFKELQYDINKSGYILSLEHSIPSRSKLLTSYCYRWLEVYEVYDDIS